MLDVYKELLVSNGYNFSKEIKNIAHTSCSDSSTIVFDFDEIKDEFTRRTKNGHCPLKSVDILYLSENTNRIYLVEMKKYDPTLDKTSKEYIDHHLQLNSVPQKVVDSINLILGIAGLHSIDQNFYSFFFDTQKLSIRPYLLVNLTAREYIRLVTSGYGQRKISITKRIDEDFKIVNCKAFNDHLNSL